MKTRRFRIAVLVLGLCGALALAGIAVAATRTKVTIHGGGGEYFGYVKSPKPNKCANGRTVKLFKQRGDRQHPRTDRLINSDTAQANNDGYQWNTGSTGVHRGKVYARAGRIPGCKPDNSKTIHAS